MNEVLQKITDAELEIMQVLWDAGEPLSIPQIRLALRRSQPWEATTIKTLVNRLHQKGAVMQEKRNLYFYSPVITRRDYADWASRRMIDRLYHGKASAFVAALVDSRDLTQEDLAELKALLEQY